jgi:hypothetical protein
MSRNPFSPDTRVTLLLEQQFGGIATEQVEAALRVSDSRNTVASTIQLKPRPIAWRYHGWSMRTARAASREPITMSVSPGMIADMKASL